MRRILPLIVCLLLLAMAGLSASRARAQDLSITQKWNPEGTQDTAIWLSGGSAGTSEVMAIPAKHVVVKFYSPGESTTCPQAGPQVRRNEDGSYSRSYSSMMIMVTCYSKPREWYEFWTDYPDKGGKFIGEWKKVEK